MPMHVPHLKVVGSGGELRSDLQIEILAPESVFLSSSRCSCRFIVDHTTGSTSEDHFSLDEGDLSLAKGEVDANEANLSTRYVSLPPAFV